MVNQLLDIDCGFLHFLLLLFEFTVDYLLIDFVLHYFILQDCIFCHDLLVSILQNCVFCYDLLVLCLKF